MWNKEEKYNNKNYNNNNIREGEKKCISEVVSVKDENNFKK